LNVIQEEKPRSLFDDTPGNHLARNLIERLFAPLKSEFSFPTPNLMAQANFGFTFAGTRHLTSACQTRRATTQPRKGTLR
jgi:hypothetical protein